MNKAALYVRVSTSHQIDKDSLPFQKKELINYAKYALDIEHYEIFEDAGYSGKDTNRPKFQEMMTRIRGGEFTHLLVWKIDRVSRNLLDFTSMYEELKEYNITFISKNDQFDTSSAMGEAMLKIVLVFAELERKITAERVYSIMLSRAEKGKWNGANVPLGYQWDEKSKFPIPHLEESKTVQMIFNLYEKYASATQVSNELFNQDIETKRGGLWTNKTVVDIIRNPFYKGTYRYNYRKGARGKIKKEAEWIIIDDNHDAIIDKDLWQRCNDVMDRNAERNSAMHRKNTHVHIFGTLIKCGECGSYFLSGLDRARTDGYRPSRYRCRNRAHKHGCNAKIVSDITLGPFVFNYIANILKAYKAIDTINTPNDLEKILLSGQEFKSIKCIDSGLNELFNVLKYAKTENIILSLSDKPKEAPSIRNQQNLQNQKNKFNRALERLENLYLFDDDAMSEKDYILKKNKIISALNDIEKKIKVISLSDHGHKHNLDIIKKSATFLLTSELTDKNSIDFREMIATIEIQLAKDFIASIIESICVTDGQISSIMFKNGLTHQFTKLV